MKGATTMTDGAFLEWIIQMLSPLGDVTSRAMMGDWCLYLNGVYFGCVCDGALFLKVFPENRDFLKDCNRQPPYLGAKPLYMPNLDDEQYVRQAVYLTFLGAVNAKQRKKKLR